MLKQRVITALIMAGLFLAAIVFLPLPGLAAVFGVLVAAGGWEWSRLAGWNSVAARGLYVLATHSGITLAPAIGALMAEWIATGNRPDTLAPHGLERFPGFSG